MRPLFQQRTYPCAVFLQHAEGPLGGGQLMSVHPVVQVVVTLSVAALLALAFAFFFFFLAFLGASLADSAAGAAADAAGFSAGAVSAAQAGTTIKANKSSSVFFMVTLPFVVKKFHGLPGAKRFCSPTTGVPSLPHQASLSLAYTSRPLLKRGLSGSISAYWKRLSAALRTPAVSEPRRLNCQFRSAST